MHADTELDWVAYMEEVEGFQKACPSKSVVAMRICMPCHLPCTIKTITSGTQ